MKHGSRADNVMLQRAGQLPEILFAVYSYFFVQGQCSTRSFSVWNTCLKRRNVEGIWHSGSNINFYES